MNFDELNIEDKIIALQVFDSMLQNEQQKAMQAVFAYSSGMDFGGTSVTSLIKVPVFLDALSPQGYDSLAKIIAEAYIAESEKILPELKNAFTPEEVRLFMQHGIFYGIHISPKLLGLSEGLMVDHEELILDGFPEPYALPKHSRETVDAYFAELKRQKGLDLNMSSLVLADTTTPKGFEGKKILNPASLNDKLSILSEKVNQALTARGYRIDPLYMVSSDTDSPDRIHLSEGRSVLEGYPLTPGLTLCGSTASMDGFDFRYIYRIGLISQMLSSNIVSSKMTSFYRPFVLVGMLSPFGYSNGAIPTGEMGNLRYPGDMNIRQEFIYQFDKNIARMI